MKHLKSYYNIPDSIIQDLQDICLELTDIGFYVRVAKSLLLMIDNKLTMTDTKTVFINIMRPNFDGSFKYDRVSETIERIKHYISLQNSISIDSISIFDSSMKMVVNSKAGLNMVKMDTDLKQIIIIIKNNI